MSKKTVFSEQIEREKARETFFFFVGAQNRAKGKEGSSRRMGDGGASRTVSALPPPPPYFRLYTDQRVAAGLAPQPPPVVEGAYTMFGRLLTTEEVEDRLENHPGRVRLYASSTTAAGAGGSRRDTADEKGEEQEVDEEKEEEMVDHKRELKKLCHSVLFNYLELLQALVSNPREYSHHEKAEDLEQLFVNIHFLLNSFRPHQARETLASILAEQLNKRRALLRSTKTAFHDVSSRLHDSLAALAMASSSSASTISSTSTSSPSPWSASTSSLPSLSLSSSSSRTPSSVSSSSAVSATDDVSTKAEARANDVAEDNDPETRRKKAEAHRLRLAEEEMDRLLGLIDDHA